MKDPVVKKKDQLAVTACINFGHLYHGEEKEIVAYLVNNGPVPVSYDITINQGTE